MRVLAKGQRIGGCLWFVLIVIVLTALKLLDMETHEQIRTKNRPIRKFSNETVPGLESNFSRIVTVHSREGLRQFLIETTIQY
jgi:hypothetical protein